MFCRSCKKFFKQGSIEEKRVLYVFDFDKTLVSNNSEDIYKEFLTPKSTRELIANEAILTDWTLMCRAILSHLKANGVSVKQILARAQLLKFLDGMDQLLMKVFVSTIQNGNNHLVILSGSNDLIISTLLATLKIPVLPNLIIANHLHFSEEENYLVFEPFHPGPTGCPFCPSILCKGAALEAYIRQNGPFDLIYYTGDGGNDVCPAVRCLQKQDVLFVRIGCSLEAAIKAGSYNNTKFKVLARVIYFADGKQIEKDMKILNQDPPGVCS